MLNDLNDLMDKEAMAFLELDELLKKFKPASHYGKCYFQNPRVYVKGDEELLSAHYERLRYVEPLWNSISKERIKRCLSELKNISHSLAKLEDGQVPSVVDFFEIKKFYFFLIV